MELKKITICVSGSPRSASKPCGIDALEVGRMLGREIATMGATLTATTTTGFPMWAAIGVNQIGGRSLAFSPASSQKEHKEIFSLPDEYFDMIIYTGFGSAGSSLLALRSSDAIVFGCGGMVSLLECTTAIEQKKVIGILEGSWDTDEVLHKMITEHYPEYPHVIRSGNPKELLEMIYARLEVIR